MRTLLALCALGIGFCSCFSHKRPNPDILPKHISQMPLRKNSEENFLETEARNLRLLNDSIKSIAMSVQCTDSEEWRITPLGSKPCGGPKEYIPYHKDVEQKLISLVQDYTRREAHYNILAGLTSDCALVPQPTGVACQNGKPILLSKNETPSP